MIHSALLVVLHRCLLKEPRAPREGQYKPVMDGFMLLTLTSADFLTKQGLRLLSLCIVGNDRLNLF